MFNAEKQKLVDTEFAAIKDVIFLNSCLASVPPLRVQKAYQREMEQFIASHGSEDDNAENQARARRNLAWLINAEEDEIALSNNTTAGMDVITLGYPWDPEKEIVIYEKEHFANLVDVLLRKGENRYKLNTIEFKEDGVRADDYIERIGPNTQAVVVSDVQYGDGARVDVKRIGQACAKYGALLILDSIQSIGRLEMDVKANNVAFLACGGHKGLLCRNGIGFMYCRRDVMQKIRPFNGGHMSFTRSIFPFVHDFDGTLPWKDDARKFENGNLNDPGVYAISESLSLIKELGKKDIEEHILWLQSRFFDFYGRGDHRVIARGDMPGGIMIFPFDEENRDQVREIMKKYKIYGTLRLNNLRVCINFYNTEEQMKTLAEAVKEIVALYGEEA